MKLIELTKICTKCGERKVWTEFYNKKGGKFNKTSECKICTNKRNLKWFEENPEKAQELQQIRSRKNYMNNRKTTKIRERCRKWRKNNLEYFSNWQQEKRKINPKFKLNCNMSRAIRASLSGNKNGHHWEKLVGYTLKQLRQHLEKQFTIGMNWENYGEWHLDHKIPLVAHNFINSEHADFKKAWALFNLQPMWAKENMIKHTKLTKHFQPSLLL